ncbi:MAG: PDZ domain-containing protein [Solobacterium sp.]|nr:PDZ domain-containing protein [Solobacterium sp.]
MKKWILAAFAVLLAWNAILTYKLFSETPRRDDSGDVTENVVVDYSTDLSEMADDVRSSIVTVSTTVSGLKHTCSGILYAKDEEAVYVFTSDQIIFEGADLTVTFDSSASAEAEIVASDSESAAALLKVTPPFEVTVMRQASSEVLRQGEYAAAMGGRSPITNAAPVSFGVISKPGQRRLLAGSPWFSDIIEIDTAVTAEMLGGPLMNVGGQLVGMCVSRSASGDRMAYALSVSEMSLLFDEFMENGKAVRGALGITVRSIGDMLAYEKSERDIRLDVMSGVLVTYVGENTAAEEALYPGDILMSIDGKEIADEKSFRASLYLHEPGDTAVLQVLREGETVEVSVELQ